jgi:hypothetical protein
LTVPGVVAPDDDEPHDIRRADRAVNPLPALRPRVFKSIVNNSSTTSSLRMQH